MKNSLLIGITLSLSTLSFGQSSIKNPAENELKLFSSKSIKKSLPKNKAAGDVIWSENFTGGFPTGWTKGGATGTSWRINTAAISAQFTNEAPIASTSGGNHMLYFGEELNPNTPYLNGDAWFQTDGITLNGASDFTVKFEQQYQTCCNQSPRLDLVISTDPTFATNVFTYPINTNIINNTTVGSSTAANIKSIKISDNFGGSSATIYIRFHWNLSSHYYWMIDDISVTETESNDLVAFNEFYGTNLIPYTKIPVAQIQPIDFAMEATNVGAADQTQTILTAEVNGGAVFTASSSPITIPALTGGNIAATTDSLYTNQWTPPTTKGIPYTIALTVTQIQQIQLQLITRLHFLL